MQKTFVKGILFTTVLDCVNETRDLQAKQSQQSGVKNINDFKFKNNFGCFSRTSALTQQQ